MTMPILEQTHHLWAALFLFKKLCYYAAHGPIV